MSEVISKPCTDLPSHCPQFVFFLYIQCGIFNLSIKTPDLALHPTHVCAALAVVAKNGVYIGEGLC